MRWRAVKYPSYLTNTSGMVDAVTVSSGGAVQVWNWSPSTSAWALTAEIILPVVQVSRA